MNMMGNMNGNMMDPLMMNDPTMMAMFGGNMGMDPSMMNMMNNQMMPNMNNMGMDPSMMGMMNNQMMPNMNNMGMNPSMMGMMNNQMMLNMGGMQGMGGNTNNMISNLEDATGWNLIFEDTNNKTTYNVKISEYKTVKEAISIYKLKSMRTGKMKFIFNNKELFPEMKICQSGLNNLSRILVISIQNVIGAK